MQLPTWMTTAAPKIWSRIKQSWQQVNQCWHLPWFRYAVLGLAAVLVLFPGFVRDQVDAIRENLPGGNEGAIILETPQLFTRGRLVNDRATESAWLTEQLGRTNDLLKDDRFASADFVRFARKRLSADLNGSTTTSTSPAAAKPEDPVVAKRFADLGLKAQPLDQFEDAARYRAAIRSALMSTALDDRHDIDGNTVYRFNFNVAVVPPRGSNLIAVVNVDLSEKEKPGAAGSRSKGAKETPDPRIGDYVEVLHDWKEKLQEQIRRLVDDRSSAIAYGLELAPEENKRFQEWLADQIKGALSDLEVSAPNVPDRFYYRYQEAELRNQRQYVEGLFARIGLGGMVADAGTSKDDLLDSAIELCKFTGRLDLNFYVDDRKKREEIEQQYGELIRCPVRHSPLKAAIDLLDTLEFARARNLPERCKHASQIVDALDASAIPVYGPKKQPSQARDNDLTCKEIGERLLAARQAAGLTKRRNDIVARSVKVTVTEEKLPKSSVKLQLDTFFEIELPSTCAGHCLPVVKLKKEWPPEAYAAQLIQELQDRMHVFTYAVTPNKTIQRSEVAQRNMGEVSGAGKLFGAIPVGASAVSDSEVLGAERDPIVIGFGDWGDKNQRPDQTRFGWAMFPKMVNGFGSKRQIAENYSVSALVSLPGWWKSAQLKVRTCWIAQSELSDGHQCPPSAPQEYAFTVRLPGDAADLMQNLRFEVITFPYLDKQAQEAEVEVGRGASIIVRGGRLWRSPLVRLGGQEADKIEVLPDMRGIVARFDCVAPGAGTPGGKQKRPEENEAPLVRTLQVFTSEGATQAMPVTVRPFTSRAGHSNGPEAPLAKGAATAASPSGTMLDEPCWVVKQREQMDLYKIRIDQLSKAK